MEEGPGGLTRTERRLVALGACLLAGLALFERGVRLPPLPFADADAWSYLRPAVLLFTEGDYLHTGSREFVYPLFVHGILRLFGSWSAVAAVQHALGVAGGLVLLAAWMRIPLPEPAPRGLHRTRALLGLALLAAHLFLVRTMLYEHQLRPESVSQPVAAVLLFGAVGLVRHATRGFAAPRSLVGDATLLVLGAALLAALRPQTLLVLPAAVALLGVALLVLRPPRALAVAAVALPLSLAALGIWLPERVLAAQDPVSGRFMSGVLFFWHYHLVDDVLAQDAREGRLSPAKEKLVRDLDVAFGEEQRRHDEKGKWYHFQGYNPDALYYGRANELLSAHFGEDSEAYEAFATQSFLRAVARRPLAYARKVLVNLGNAYGWPDATILEHRLYVNLPRLVVRTLRQLEPHRAEIESHEAGSSYLEGLARRRDALGRPDEPRTWLFGSKRLAKRGSDLYHALNGLYVPLLLGVAVLVPFRSRWNDGGVAATAVVAAGLAFACHLTSSLVHGLETMRYVFGIAGLSLFSLFAAALFVGVRAAALLRGRQPGPLGGRDPGL